ncbi:MAG: PAAR-like domain-containing protein [Candidatus Hodarchaeota archaeon]
MKITSLKIALVAVALSAIVGLNNAYSGVTVFENMRSVVHKGGEMTGTFPDICKTPTPGGPIPIPYPNIVPASASDFPTGTKAIKGGGNIRITGTTIKTSSGDERAYKVTVKDKTGRNITLDRSKLFELTDGTFCAVCVEDGLLTSILRLRIVQQK